MKDSEEEEEAESQSDGKRNRQIREEVMIPGVKLKHFQMRWFHHSQWIVSDQGDQDQTDQQSGQIHQRLLQEMRNRADETQVSS